MDYSLISVRYAKALFLLSQEKDIVDSVYQDMILINDQIEKTKSFMEVLNNPVIKPELKKRSLTSIFEKYVHETTMKFLIVLVDNKRERMLDSIARNFIDDYKIRKGIKSATIYTAIPLSEDYINKVKVLLEKELASIIELKVVVKDSLLGGFILMVDGKMMDASILSKLKALKNKLLN